MIDEFVDSYLAGATPIPCVTCNRTVKFADPTQSGQSTKSGGAANYLFADGHVESISDKIDPNIYLWMTTRNGGETIP